MSRRTIKLTSREARQRAHALIDAAPEGYAVAIGEETRSQEQNRLMWPLIADLQAQVEGMAAFSADDIKLRFLNALGTELRFLPELEGAGMFPVGQRSSTLSKSQFTGLIELMFAFGSKHGVNWSRKSLDMAARSVALDATPIVTAAINEAAQAAGWIVGNADGTTWRTWDGGFPVWTNDPDKATRYARREDAEAVHAEDEDVWRVVQYAAIEAHKESQHG